MQKKIILWRHALVGVIWSCITFINCSFAGQSVLTAIDYALTKPQVGRLVLQFDAIPDMTINADENILRLSMRYARADKRLPLRFDLRDFDTPLSFLQVDKSTEPDELVLNIQRQRDFEYVVETKEKSIVLIFYDVVSSAEASTKSQSAMISVDLQNVSLKHALMTLANMMQLDVVLPNNMNEKVTLQLSEVPWRQAWQVLLDNYALHAQQNGQVLSIKKMPDEDMAVSQMESPELQQPVLTTRQIKVHYADAVQIANVIEKQLYSVGSNAHENKHIVQGAQTYTLLSPLGRISVDERTNSLIIKEQPQVMKQINDLVARLDVPVPQVEIETRLVQVREDVGRDLGVRLGFALSSLAHQSRNNPVYIGQAGQLSASRVLRDGQVNQQLQTTNNDFLSVNLPAGNINGSSAASYALSLYNPSMHWLRALDIELSAIEAQGRGRILASPKILTLNKQQATIEQGEERLAVIQGEETSRSETQKAVLKLSVLPHITPGNDIVLDVQISNDNFVDALAGLISTNRINTKVRLNDGQTMMVGGIYTTAQANNEAKVPWFGDLPLIGNLFKRRSNLAQRAELLVFLTPRILPIRSHE